MTSHNLLEALRAALGATYEVERELGAGGMGSVFLGRDRTLERPVAIKVISPELAATRAFRQRFLQEARTVARLRHPSIVDVYAAGAGTRESGGEDLLYFVMEYVPGESLRDLIDREGRIPPARVARILRELAGALAYAHERSIVHRDIKPENVLLDRDTDRAMLTDFGVAQALAQGAGGDERMTGTGFVVGSPRYMSPEQAAGDRTLDGRSDIYSLGLVGYEMLTGEPAFTAATAASLLVKQITEPAAPVATRVHDAPPALADAIDRALRKDPGERWQGGAELAQALGDGAMTGERSGRSSVAPTRGGRRRDAWLLGGAVAAGLLAVTAGFLVSANRSGVPKGVDPRRSFFVAPFENQTGDPSLNWLREGSVNMLTLNLSTWRDLKVADYDRVLDLLRDADLENTTRIGLEDARRLAREAGVWTVVLGQVTRGRDSMTVIARAYDVASGSQLKQVQASAPTGADPRMLFDRLSRELLDLAGAPPMTPELAATTTQSFAAYRAYLAGVRALNDWELAAADAHLERAIAEDSTFALAYYRRALVRGWQTTFGDTSGVHFARLARRYADRLGERERALIDGQLALSLGIRAQSGGTQADAKRLLAEAQDRYRTLIARDSADTEAWYGLADALFHTPPSSQAEFVETRMRSLRAFDRTIALDSSFHLAYEHRSSIYSMGAGANSGIIVVADSLIDVSTPALAEAYGRPRIDSARAVMRRRAVENARHWVDADPNAPHAYSALADAYLAAGDPAAAGSTLRGALQRPGQRSPLFAYRIASIDLLAGKPEQALVGLRSAMRTYGYDSIVAYPDISRFGVISGSAAVAAHAGAIGEMNDVLALVARVDPMLPGAGPGGKGFRTSDVTAHFGRLNSLAMGLPFSSLRKEIDAQLRTFEALGDSVQGEVAQTRVMVAYYAYVLGRDTTYLERLRTWAPALVDSPPLRALQALEAGDSTEAARLASGFPRGDTLKARAIAVRGGLDAYVEAEVLTAVGDARGAIATYEGIRPERYQVMVLPDPRWPLYARSFLARGRLYEQLGEPERAVAAYTRFLELWKEADPRLQPQLRDAREGLARLRDTPPSTGVAR
ncbi:MAG: protein kinase [Gemmatimonadota bacterium]|nr:protein kinase [Gemmatimonadota bacterium]